MALGLGARPHAERRRLISTAHERPIAHRERAYAPSRPASDRGSDSGRNANLRTQTGS